MTTGLIIGKFWPLHAGHSKLIERAQSECDRVVVVVCEGGEDVPAWVRREWILASHPLVVCHILNNIEDGDTPEQTSLRWAKHVEQEVGEWEWYTFDKVYLGDDYPEGNRFAEFLGAERVSVPRDEVSGTKVRENPRKYWDALSPPVRAHYATRIVVVGAESTGTTTLAKGLAAALGTVWVPEYGRTYTEGRGLDLPWTTDEFWHIQDVQNQMEEQLARKCNRYLICDTDAWATDIWHERYVGSRMEVSLYNRRTPDLYLLTDDEGVPFVQDGLRDGEHLRRWMTLKFDRALKDEHRPFAFITGSRGTRLERALQEIERRLG